MNKSFKLLSFMICKLQLFYQEVYQEVHRGDNVFNVDLSKDYLYVLSKKFK